MLGRNLQFLIDRRGQTATLVKTVVGQYDPATGSTSGGDSPEYTIKAYFGEFTLEEADTDTITFGDRRVAIAALDTSGQILPEPDEEDVIKGVGDDVIIKGVQKIYNSGTLVCYICTVRE